jgi:hypothetical protein
VATSENKLNTGAMFCSNVGFSVNYSITFVRMSQEINYKLTHMLDQLEY